MRKLFGIVLALLFMALTFVVAVAKFACVAIRYIVTNFVINSSTEARWLQVVAVFAGFMASLAIRGHHGGPPSDPLLAWIGSYAMIFVSTGVLGAYLVHAFRDAEKKRAAMWLPSTRVVQ